MRTLGRKSERGQTLAQSHSTHNSLSSCSELEHCLIREPRKHLPDLPLLVGIKDRAIAGADRHSRLRPPLHDGTLKLREDVLRAAKKSDVVFKRVELNNNEVHRARDMREKAQKTFPTKSVHGLLLVWRLRVEAIESKA